MLSYNTQLKYLPLVLLHTVELRVTLMQDFHAATPLHFSDLLI